MRQSVAKRANVISVAENESTCSALRAAHQALLCPDRVQMYRNCVLILP